MNAAWPGLIRLALRDLRGSLAMRALWVFVASLFLGISLIAACGGLLQIVRDALDRQELSLFGGDVVIEDRKPLDEESRAWVEANGTLSELIELRTMIGRADGGFTAIELQSVDERYPLYGEVQLSPPQTLQSAVAKNDEGIWGAAYDPVLASRLGLSNGDRVRVGELELELRARIDKQPDRSLRADVRGPPVIVDREALRATGLDQPTSLIDYEYRVRIDEPPDTWRERLRTRFPDASWEVQTHEERGEFIGERLNQVASVLLLIGFSTLFIGGLGVSNSVQAYLQSKRGTLASLQAIGARHAQTAVVFITQIVVLAGLASLAASLVGAAVAGWTASALGRVLPVASIGMTILPVLLISIVFGILTALLFALPALGRSLNTPAAALVRGEGDANVRLPRRYRVVTALLAVATAMLLLVAIPEPLIGLGFLAYLALMLWLLDRLDRGIRRVARHLAPSPWLEGRFAFRLALAALYRPDSSLRPLLLSLGSALSLLVAATLVIAATVRTLEETVPERAPSLVFYDIQKPDVQAFDELLSSLDGYQAHQLAPLVLGRLTHVNGEPIAESVEARRALEANDEHKLSYRVRGIDNTVVDRGQWWPDGPTDSVRVAMEDREADQVGVAVGDQLRFEILGEPLEATLDAIYAQARFETRFWLEAVFSEGALDPFISRYIGSARLDAGADIEALDQIAEQFPAVLTLRTARLLEAAREILYAASLAMAAIALVSLTASVLVMASVVAVTRQRQIYESSVIHALGARRRTLLQAVLLEYALLAVLLTTFALLSGSLIAVPLLQFWLKLPATGVWYLGLATAATASILCLLAGAIWLARSLVMQPAQLLRRA